MSNFDNQFWELQRKRAKKLEEEEKAKKTTSAKDDDIAPVKTTTTTTTTKDEDKKWYDGYLQWGDALSDKISVGNIAKTLIGTDADILTNAISGVVGWGEDIVDAGATKLGEIYEKLGRDDKAKSISEFVAKDLYDEKEVSRKILGSKALSVLMPGFGNAVNGIMALDDKLNTKEVDNGFGGTTIVREDNSILGDDADAMITSGGEILVKQGLQAAAGGVPVGDIITGVTVYGAQAEQAIKEGATLSEASRSGLISAGAEIIFEKLSGGIKIGGKTLDEGLTKLISKNISNVALKNFLHFTSGVAGESLEELATEFVSKLGTKLYKEEDLGEILFSEESLDDYCKATFAGGLMGGTFNVQSAVDGTKKGRDYKSGLTDNEQKVIDQEVANRVAEAEEDGKKLTTKEKNKIYDEVIDDLRKGYISTDAIESIFGGEDYKAYQSILEKEQPLRDEINSIESNDSLTDEQKQTLIKSVEDKLNALATETNKAQVRQKLDDVMKSQLVRKVGKNTQTDRFLLESYNEGERRRQKFEADLAKYDAKQAEVIKKAVDSGILNNTNRTHEFVDMVAKISADKGVLFDFANNAKLKESGFAMNGKRVNGYVTKDGITVNIDSHKSLNSVVGHEIAHVLEGTELYTEMQNALFEYAKSKNDYDGRYKDLEALYKGVEGASVDAELTADLVGDYLFTDSDFINSLSTKNRNVFQKIYDEIKYLCKIATAGSKEARELERVKRAFDKAYREAGKAQSDTKYSLSEDAKKADADYLDAVDRGDTEMAQRTLDAVARDAGYKRLFYHGTPNGDFTKFNTHGKPIWIAEDKAYAEVYAREKSGYKEDERVMPLYAKMGKTLDLTQVDTSKLLFEPVPNTIPRSDINFPSEELKKLADLVGVDASGLAQMCKNTPYESIWELVNTKQFANLVKEKGYDSIKEDEFGNITYGVFNSSQLKSADAITYDWKKKAIPLSKRFNTENKDIRYSLSADTQGRELSANQRNYFKDSKIVDDNGNLKVMYHGTPNGDFSVFKDGTYFTENKWYADLYQNPGASSISTGKVASNPKTFEVYLNIKKPFDINDAEARSIYINDYIKGGNAVGINPYLPDAEYNKINSIDWTEGEDLRDFLIDNDYDYDGLVLDEGAVGGYGDDVKYRGKSYVVFSPEQIKNVDNLNPTSDPDIRFSLSKEDNDYLDAVKRGDMETAQKMVDDAANSAGYTIKAYHGTPNIEFTIFDKGRVGKGNDQYGAGFYFATSKEAASHYGQRVIDSALDIKNPIRMTASKSVNNLIQADVTLTSKQAYEVVKRLPGIYDAEESPLGDYFDDYWEEGAQDWMIRELAEQYRDVGMLDSDLFRYYPNELHEALRDVVGYDGVEVTFESTGEKFYVAWFDNQMKSRDPVTYDDNGDIIPLAERFKAERNDIRYSLSTEGDHPVKHGNYNVYGEDIALETEEAAPMQETVAETVTDADGVPFDTAPITEEEANALQSENFASLDDADAPPETEAPYYGESEDIASSDPFKNRDIKEVGNRKVKAYMYENPEVKPFFQEEANIMLGELRDTTRGERFYTQAEQYDTYGSDSYGKWTGISRQTTDDIAYLLDKLKYSYDEIERGLNAIIEDNGKENNACSKRIEFLLNDRLLRGYQTIDGFEIPANDDYINLLNEKQIIEYNEEARKRFFEVADELAPPEDIAPVEEIKATPKQKATEENIAPTPTYETKKQSEVKGQRTMFPEGKVAEVLSEEPKIDQNKRSAWSMFKNNVLDKGMVFEDLSLETGNRELQARWNSIRYAEGKAQKLIGEGNASVSSLKSIQETVENSGKTKQFYEYLYHKHNVDRMSLEEKAKPTILALQGKFENLKEAQIKAIAAKEITDNTTEKTANTIREAREYLKAMETKNKPVFGDSITAEVSRDAAAKLEKANPEFKEYAREVYDYMNYLREMLVDAGVISSDTAKLWAEMYPNYVPIRRAGDTGLNIDVPLDTGRTGVNAPIKRATGGNRDILPLFDTMALRTEQTFKAIAKNRFGVELKNTLGTTIADETTSVDDAIDSIDTQDGLLQEGKNGKSPTFTVFENGNKVTFEITEEMYDAMKPTSKGLSYTNKVANTVGNVFRGLLTEYNPVFMATNAIKDAQDVLINSQHAAKTYASIPKAIAQMAGKGHWYQEYLANGGEQNTYFDSQTNTFKAEDEGIKKLIGMPLRGISYLNNTIERIPRLAEYIASRESGRSIDVSMLDAARVTTNFAAGGDVTKFFNRNGFNFLNASMQGAMQQARNVREAKANGLKGWMQLATKVALAGLPAILLNNLLWDDDEEYEELSDYVKQNYYVVAKFGDGKFVRIPKGRTLAVIQNAFEQMGNLITGDDEADLESFLELAISNLAPNNPLENNILAPIMQVKNNETWYGEDLVPTRLQDLPAAEQCDESTDAISKWLGEKLNVSPYKLNYLLNQYSGGLGDVFLPMMTPEAESGDNSLVGNLIAPWKDKFTTDSVMNNQYVSDFYDTVDELTANAKSSKATDEDVLKYKYINSVNAELGELYAQKREIQNSDLADDKKYAAVREIQERIDSLAKESLDTYGDVYINDGYATVGDRHYKLNDEGEWQKLSDDQLEKQEEVTSGLGIDPSDYWSNKSEYDFAYEYPEKYAVAKSIGGYDAYKTYSSELYDIKADKDENGKSINGSRKEKVIDYINNLDADYGEKIILFKSQYNADDTYNYDIIEYLNSREDISYEEMETILKELGFTVKSDGTVEW